MEAKSTQGLELFVRDSDTGRLVFNPLAIQALGLSPVEVARRGYPLAKGVASPALVPEADRADAVTID
jgi:PAS domain-containing protein